MSFSLLVASADPERWIWPGEAGRCMIRRINEEEGGDGGGVVGEDEEEGMSLEAAIEGRDGGRGPSIPRGV